MFVKKVIAGAVVAGAISLSGLASGVVSGSEDINIGVGELQECTISKSMDGNVDGRDFLVWQRNTGATDAEPTEEVAFYYNKIAFQYAPTATGKEFKPAAKAMSWDNVKNKPWNDHTVKVPKMS